MQATTVVGMELHEYTTHQLFAQDPAAPLRFDHRDILAYEGRLPAGEWSENQIEALWAHAVRDYYAACASDWARARGVAFDRAARAGSIKGVSGVAGVSVSAVNQVLKRHRDPRFFRPRGGLSAQEKRVAFDARELTGETLSVD